MENIAVIQPQRQVRHCLQCYLGLIDYAKAYAIQEKLWAYKMRGEPTDALLLLEHPPTFTIGKSGTLENLLLTRDELAAKGFSLYFTDRGGDITYHGPGQIVIYPIVDLHERGKDIHRYVHDVLEVGIRTLADFAIKAHRDRKNIGIWVGNDKIAAVGIRVRKWITTHGLALNVNPKLEHFSFINPCGIVDRGVTSMSNILGYDLPINVVIERIVDNFSYVFNAHVEIAPSELLRRPS